MKVGIIAEGPSDVAVLRNILKGKLNLDRKDVLPIRPELAEDETDLAAPGRGGAYQEQSEQERSNWLFVLRECEARESIESFLDSPLEEERLVVVQIDTAEAHLTGYDVARPADRKARTYCDELRQRVVDKINALLGPELAERVRHAVAVEETDAWVLTIHDRERQDTSSRGDPKKRLDFLLQEKGSTQKAKGAKGASGPKRGKGGARAQTVYELYHTLSEAFRDAGQLAACTKRNRSLLLFVDSL